MIEIELVGGMVLRVNDRKDIDWVTFAVIVKEIGGHRMIPWTQIKEVRFPLGTF